MTRVLLGMLGSNGDCLYATAIAKQIKQDFRGCHLTWAVCSLSKSVILNNPDIDAMWEIPLANWADMERAWHLFETEAHILAEAGRFDYIFLTQISPGRFSNYDGTVRPSIFRNYPRQLTVPVEVTIELDAAEKEAVDKWFAASAASDASQAVLFECSSKSGQSSMNVDRAIKLAEFVTSMRQRAVVIISTHEAVEINNNPRIISAGCLGIRQTARLTDYVDLFVGCGSGLTVAATSSAAKQGLPNIQILRRYTSVYASFRHDFAYYGKPVSQFMELTSEDPDHLGKAILASLSDGFESAKAEFDDPVPLTFDWYIEVVSMMLIDVGRYVEAAQSLLVTAQRYGWHPQLRRYGKHFILPFLDDDPRSQLPHRRAEAELLKAGIG